jgi:hypothetical protein
MEGKEFNVTSHFYCLPQGERRIGRISPSPLPSPAEWRGKSEDGKVLMDKIKGEFEQWEGYGRVIRSF